MSTRYVWGRYTKPYYEEEVEENYTGGIGSSTISNEEFYRGTGMVRNEDEGLYYLQNAQLISISVGNTLNMTGYYYLPLSAVNPYDDTCYYGGTLSAYSNGGNGLMTSTQGTIRYKYDYHNPALRGYASSGNAGAYPQDGISGNYWYEYAGSDNIDAASVGYSTLEPRGGEAITINVTPSSGKVYSGTVSYLYQVQLDGGAWTTIATTTATSQNYTIPNGTTTFAARVRAQDDIGFTSSTYTTGATVTVKNSNAFVGVGGVVRNVEPRVCVNGVIYTNVTSYVCVDGVIRQS